MSDKGKDIFKNTVRVVTAGAIVLGACDRLPNKDSSTVTQPGTTPGLVVPPPDGTEISSGGVTTEAPFVTPISTEVSIVGYGGQLTVEQQVFTETQRAQGMKIGLENYVNYWEEFKVFADGTQLSLIPYQDQSDPTNINKMVYVAEVSGDLNYDGFVITIPIAQYQKYLETGDPQVMTPPQNAVSLMENTDPFKMTKQVKEGSIPNLAGIPIGAVNGVMNGEFVYFAPGTTGALEVVGKLDENFKWVVERPIKEYPWCKDFSKFAEYPVAFEDLQEQGRFVQSTLTENLFDPTKFNNVSTYEILSGPDGANLIPNHITAPNFRVEGSAPFLKDMMCGVTEKDGESYMTIQVPYYAEGVPANQWPVITGLYHLLSTRKGAWPVVVDYYVNRMNIVPWDIDAESKDLATQFINPKTKNNFTMTEVNAIIEEMKQGNFANVNGLVLIFDVAKSSGGWYE